LLTRVRAEVPQGVTYGDVTGLFADAGARVIATDIDEARLAALCEQHPTVVTVAGDVATPEGADALIAAAGNRLDVLCNNAALIEATVLEETDEALWDEVIRVNLTGPFLLSKRALPLMLEGGGGAIVNTGSPPRFVATAAGLPTQPGSTVCLG
jgi:NAD(P)-dependent dehydrogenase (short-subunit alcohol dehydrogenase family)